LSIAAPIVSTLASAAEAPASTIRINVLGCLGLPEIHLELGLSSLP
jgi:hypothetical protein